MSHLRNPYQYDANAFACRVSSTLAPSACRLLFKREQSNNIRSGVQRGWLASLTAAELQNVLFLGDMV